MYGLMSPGCVAVGWGYDPLGCLPVSWGDDPSRVCRAGGVMTPGPLQELYNKRQFGLGGGPQAPPPPQDDPSLFELPPLIIDGIPTPVEKMTQAQLRAFIPLMLKYSMGKSIQDNLLLIYIYRRLPAKTSQDYIDYNLKKSLS